MTQPKQNVPHAMTWIMAGVALWGAVAAVGVYWSSHSPWRLLIPVIMLGSVAGFLGLWLIVWRRQRGRSGARDADRDDSPNRK